MERLDECLVRHEGQVDGLLKLAQQFSLALKGWKRACVEGVIAERQKNSEKAVALAVQINQEAQAAAEEWVFEARAYLASDDWQRELIEAASKHPSGPKIRTEGGELVCSPLVIRSDPGGACLRLGRVRWTKLRPRKVIDELLRIRRRAEKQNVQQFLDSLWAATQHLTRGQQKKANTVHTKLRDVYDLWCLTPGWKKENSEAAFAQYLYALHRSEVALTRDGKRYEYEFPTGHPKSKDVFEVVAEDGRTIRYYMIHFRQEDGK